MKLWLVTFLMATTMFVAGKSETFEEFEAINNKKYSNPIERIKRAKIFADNLNRIDELNKDKSGATFGVNQFADLTPEEFSKTYNGYTPVKLASNETLDAEISRKAAIFNNKPTTNVFDWAVKGYMGPVKDQKSCGSCWAFTTVAVVETYWTRLGKSYTSFSEQELVDCLSGNNCNGGSVYKGLLFEQAYGAMKSTDYPYTAVNGRCSYVASKVVVAPKIIYYTNYESNFAYVLQYYGPIGVGMNGNALQLYKGGIMDLAKCPKNIVNHAVTLVGYGTENGVNYWRFRNSWGSTWGEAGHFRTLQGINACGIINYSAFFANPN